MIISSFASVVHGPSTLCKSNKISGQTKKVILITISILRMMRIHIKKIDTLILLPKFWKLSPLKTTIFKISAQRFNVLCENKIFHLNLQAVLVRPLLLNSTIHPLPGYSGAWRLIWKIHPLELHDILTKIVEVLWNLGLDNPFRFANLKLELNMMNLSWKKQNNDVIFTKFFIV